MWLRNKKIKNVCRQKASCSGDTLLCLLVASWSSLSWCHPSLAANTFWIFYPVTGLLPCDYNFSPPCASGSINNINNLRTPSTATPSSGLFYFNFFHPCKVGGSTTMEVAVQCHMTKCWQNCMHLAEGGEWSNNLPCHAYLPGRWWHDTKHSPLNDTKQHMQHLCSTWLIVSSSHFQKLPDKNYFFVWQKNFRYFFWNCSKCVECVECIERVDLERKNSPRNQKTLLWESKKKLYYLIWNHHNVHNSIPVGKYRITKLEFRFYILIRILFKKLFWAAFQVQEYHW